MVNPSLIDYVKEWKAKGYTEDQLRDWLVQKGNNPDEVEEAIREAGNVQGKTDLPSGSAGIKKRNPLIVLLLIFITFGIYGIFWLVFTTKELKNNTSSAPTPWHLLLFLIPVVGIVIAIMYYWKYSKAVNELTGFNNTLLFVLWFVVPPAATVLTQLELNKKA